MDPRSNAFMSTILQDWPVSSTTRHIWDQTMRRTTAVAAKLFSAWRIAGSGGGVDRDRGGHGLTFKGKNTNA